MLKRQKKSMYMYIYIYEYTQPYMRDRQTDMRPGLLEGEWEQGGVIHWPLSLG